MGAGTNTGKGRGYGAQMPGPASIAGKYPQGNWGNSGTFGISGGTPTLGPQADILRARDPWGNPVGSANFGNQPVFPGGTPTLGADGGNGWQPPNTGGQPWYGFGSPWGLASPGTDVSVSTGQTYNPTGQRSDLASVLAGGQKYPMAGYGTGLEADSYTPAGGMIPVGKGPTMGGGGKPSIGNRYGGGGGKPRIGYGGGVGPPTRAQMW